MFEKVGTLQICRSQLAGDGDFTGAIAGKPAPTGGGGMFGIWASRKICRSQLAGDSDFADAIAGKPIAC
ncbi:hypothetical protein ACF6ZU_23015 [Pseudomonas migulae]|uniref:hypothetical protein n=1 Tax=Pseudomonas migulae TaxID=78543 RepID=UPI00370FDC7C